MRSKSQTGQATSIKCEEVARAALGEPRPRKPGDGQELFWTCSQHNDQHPSLKVNAKKNTWICGPCGASGNAWELAAFLLGLGFKYESLSDASKQQVKEWLIKHNLLPHRAPASKGKRSSGTPKEPAKEQKLVATYDYKDESGNLLFQVVRYDPKGFRQRRPDGRGGWIWHIECSDSCQCTTKLPPTRRVLYHLDEIAATESACEYVTTIDNSQPTPEETKRREDKIAALPWIPIPEGEKDVEAARKLGFVATCNPGGAGKWRDEYSPSLIGRKVCVFADPDQAGLNHAQQVCKSVSQWAAVVKLVDHMPLDGAKDLSDFINHFPDEATAKRLVEAMIEEAPEWKPPSGSAILDEVKSFFAEWLSVPESVLVVLTVWTAATYVFQNFRHMPLLHVHSPEPACGKTTLLKLLKLVVCRGHYTDSPTESTIFRRIDRDHPTMLPDEMDTTFSGKDEKDKALQRILNSVFERGSGYERTEQINGKWEVVPYDVHCPVAFATIRREIVPVATRSRTIPILMQRLRGKPRFRETDEQIRAAGDLARRLEAWIKNADLETNFLIPKFRDDARDVDRAEILLSVAEAAGGAWIEATRDALWDLLVTRKPSNESRQGKLLADLKTIFHPRDENNIQTIEPRDRIGSVELACALGKLETSAWTDYGGRTVCRQCGGHHITPEQIKRLLGDFTDKSGHRIAAKAMRIEGRLIKGYERIWFESAWKAYLGDDSAQAFNPEVSTVAAPTLPMDMQGETAPGMASAGSDPEKGKPYELVMLTEWRSMFAPDLQPSISVAGLAGIELLGTAQGMTWDEHVERPELGRGGYKTGILDDSIMEHHPMPGGQYETRDAKK